jgi:predicted ester cyclase
MFFSSEHEEVRFSPQGGSFALAPSVLAFAHEERRNATTQSAYHSDHIVFGVSCRPAPSEKGGNTQRSICYVNRRQQGTRLSRQTDSGRTSVIIDEEESLMSDEQNKALVRRYFEEVLPSRNTDLVDEIFDANYIYHYSDAPAALPPGMDGFKVLVKDYLSGFSNLRLTVDDQTVEGDKVVTQLTAHASNIGAMRAAPELSPTPTAPTDIPDVTPVAADPTSFRGRSIDRIANGKIVESWVEFDVPSAEQKLGFSPPGG